MEIEIAFLGARLTFPQSGRYCCASAPLILTPPQSLLVYFPIPRPFVGSFTVDPNIPQPAYFAASSFPMSRSIVSSSARPIQNA